MNDFNGLAQRHTGDLVGKSIDARPWCDPIRRAIAKNNRITVYPDYCDNHGVAPFSTKTGRCLSCAKYDATCHVHGVVPHRAKTGKCLTCEPFGSRRSKSPRAVARHAGQTSYLTECGYHGLARHGVMQGKCLMCFTASGRPRVNPGERRAPGPAETPRSAARKAGLKTWTATCAVHGVTSHSVAHGRCLTCFNAMGLRRP